MKKLMKILGIVMVVAILAGMLIVPAMPAAAANMAWSAVGTPSTTSNVLVPGGSGAAKWLMDVAADGKTIFAYDNNTLKLYKSVDGGVTFASIGVGTGLNANTVSALAVSSNYASDSVVIAGVGKVVYTSVNGGATFSALVADISTIVAGATKINSVDAAAHYNGQGTSLLVATDAGAAILEPGGAFGSAFTAAGLPAVNTLGAAFSPNFKTDGMLFFVTQVAGVNSVETKRGPTAVDAAFVKTTLAGVTVSPTAASFAFPADYDVDLNNVSYVGLNGVNGDAFRVRLGVSNVALAVSGAANATSVNSLSFKGNAVDGYLYVGTATGGVYRATATTASVVTFTPATKKYGATNAVVFASPVAADTNIFLMTSGTGSAFSVSTDGAVTFNLLSLIGVSALTSVSVIDLAVIDANTMYAVLQDAGAPAFTALFKTTNAGTNWIGVLEVSAAGVNLANVYPSPAYATDNVVYVTQNNSTIFKTANAGTNFSSLFTGNSSAITAFAPVDATTFFVASATGIYKGTNFTPAPVTNATSIVRLSATDMYVGTSAGSVYRSTNDGVSFTIVGNGAFGAANMVVLPDVAYATNNTVYAGSTAGIFRFVVGGTSVAWSTINANNSVAGLGQGTDGTLYASTVTAAIGLYRSVNPISPVPFFEPMVSASLTGFPAGAASNDNVIKILATGSATVPNNTLFVIATGIPFPAAPAKVYTFQDTMVQAPAITAPAAASSVSPTTTLSWTGIATSVTPTYQVTMANDSAFQGLVTLPAGPAPLVAGQTKTTSMLLSGANALINGQTYYVKVQAIGPLTSKTSAVVMFNAKLATLGSTLTLNGLSGSTTNTVSTKPVFSWTGVDGAVSYNLQVSDNPVFVNPLDNQTGLNTTVWAETKTLTAGTTYYYRVQAVSASGTTSDWVAGTFATAAAAPTPTGTATVVPPPITITNTQPTIIITQPVLTITNPAAPAPSTPATIWVVIAIGAILVIAVIVLIARTRRV